MIKRIGIIGDVHAEHDHLERALAHLADQHVDAVVCTGDIVDGRGDVARCVALLAEHAVTVVRGNHDRWLLQDKARHVPNAHHKATLDDTCLAFLAQLPTQVTLETVAGQLLLCHGVGKNDLQKVWPGTERMPVERSTRLDEIIANDQVRWLINGHMHYRTVIHFEAMTLINAGTLRGDHHPGFAVLDLDSQHLTGYEFMPAPEAVRTLQLNQPPAEVFSDTQAFTGQWQPLTLYAG